MLSDVLDGYFPFDLKKKYPEGVPLRPVDLTDEMYIIPGKPSQPKPLAPLVKQDPPGRQVTVQTLLQ